MYDSGFLGIDESNHGRVPEVFVAVYSQIPEDIKDIGGLEKKRGNSTINEILCGRDYRHILIPAEVKEEFEQRHVQMIVLSEFAKCFGNLEKILVDGQVRAQIIEEVKKEISSIACPTIVGVEKGDTRIKLINIADQLANYLFRFYKNENSNKYSDKEKLAIHAKCIVPDFEHYAVSFEDNTRRYKAA